MAQCKKVVLTDHIDRISDLPSEVINTILRRLPLQDVVRTSLLSKAWRFKWASVPQLDFTNSFFDKCKNLEGHELSTIITEILLVHNGPVDRFTLSIPKEFPIKVQSLNKWILSLSRKGIKSVKLWNLQTNPYETPSHIFSCSGLIHLQLRNFKLSTVPNFCGFKSLIILKLAGIIFESGALESLMIVCPSLVMLSISYCSGFECINVSSSTLEVFHVQSDQVIKSICLEKAKNMTGLALRADKLGDNFESDMISNLIKGLSKIENICLAKGYIQIFSRSITGNLPKRLQRSLNFLKCLELDGVNFNNIMELQFVISLLKSSPNLEKLLIKSRHNISMDVGLPHILKKSKYDKCCLGHLLTVHLKVYKPCKNTLNFIEFLLANSASLEVLTFTIDLAQIPSSISSIRGDVEKMARASEGAVVKFIYRLIDW